MLLRVVIALLLLSVLAQAKDGRYAVRPAAPLDLAEDPFVRCSDLPDPAASTTALTTATSSSDLHADIMAVCGSGCIVTIGPGTYDGNVVFGDAAIKAGSITPSAEVVIRGLDPDNPPVIRATPDLRAAVIHAKNVTARIRLEDVILDGRRASQTSAGMTTVCTDTTPANGICDTGSQSSSFLNGFNTRSTVSGQTLSCLLRVQVRETVDTGIQLSQPIVSTVERSKVTGSGCTTTVCPAMSIPVDAVTNALTKTAQGIQISQGDDSAAVENDVSAVTKIGIECFSDSRRCQIQGNTVNDAYSAGIVFNNSDGRIASNTITSTGFWLSPNAASDNVGMGIQFVTDDAHATTGFATTIEDNRVSNSFGSGIQLGLSGPTTRNRSYFSLSGNSVSGACAGTTRTDSADYELGDSAQDFVQVVATGNRSASTACPDGVRVRNLTEFSGWYNTTVGGIEIDDVDWFDLYGGSITGNFDADVDTVGRARACSISGSVIGAANIVRTNCGA